MELTRKIKTVFECLYTKDFKSFYTYFYLHEKHYFMNFYIELEFRLFIE